MQLSFISWIAHCPSCGISFDRMPIPFELTTELNEPQRKSALSLIRRSAAARILRQVDAMKLTSGRRLLDVGCGYGWFLAEATSLGYKAFGIEPDRRVAEDARANGLAVCCGWFPVALAADERFDVIAFNDVLEHLIDPIEALKTAAGHLVSGGIVIVSIPVSEGIFYRTSYLLARFGWLAPIERMWQRGFPSPHTHYFTRRGFKGIARKAGLTIVSSRPKTSITIRNLWDRLNFSGEIGPSWSLPILWSAIVILSPVIYLLPTDTIDFICTVKDRRLAQ